MKYRRKFVPLSLMLLALTSSGSPVLLAVQSDSQKEEKQQPKANATKATSLTGCLDEQEGHYLLVDDRDLKPIANLEAEGFPTEGFAKHLGHKVTVRGISSSSGDRPTFKVRTIETVSEMCGPHQ
jgi:hypothetical protein